MGWPIDTIYSPTEGKAYRTTIRLPWGYRINIFWRGDHERDPHDHPNDFWTFPLKGYWEQVSSPLNVPDFPQWVKPFRRHHREAEYRHVILGAHRVRVDTPDLSLHAFGGLLPRYEYGGGFVSIVREGPNRRIWGFWPDGKFMYWKDYMKLKRRQTMFERNL